MASSVLKKGDREPLAVGRKKSLMLIMTLTVTMVLSSLVFASNVYASSQTVRLAGQNRYDTAAAIARDGWEQSSYAILAYGDNYPDALAATPLAKKYDAPILLTPKNTLTESTKQTLLELQVENVIIVGGTGVVSQSVEDQVQKLGINTTRIAGRDRYETSVKIAEQLDNVNEVVFTTGDDYADALSIASIAAVKNMPIILTPKADLTESAKNYIGANQIDKTYVIGNSTIISDNVTNQLPNPERIEGSDKYTRNIAILNRFSEDYNYGNVYIATGRNFADALTGTAYAAKLSAPIVLVDNYVSSGTKFYLDSKSDLVNRFVVLGGEGAISSSLLRNYLASDDLAYSPSEIALLNNPAIVSIEVYDYSGTPIANGSGFIADSNGKIITNYHVIEGSYSAKVKLFDGRIFDVTKVLAYDQERDLVILSIDQINLPTVTLGDSSNINTGDKVYAIGNPYGLENTISDGLISSKNRLIDGQNYVQISTPISPGSSGGVLVNEQGEVIGITTSGLENGQNLNFTPLFSPHNP